MKPITHSPISPIDDVELAFLAGDGDNLWLPPIPMRVTPVDIARDWEELNRRTMTLALHIGMGAGFVLGLVAAAVWWRVG